MNKHVYTIIEYDRYGLVITDFQKQGNDSNGQRYDERRRIGFNL